MVQYRVPRQIHVLGESAPQVRRLLVRGVAVADRVGIGAPVGGFAMPILPGVAPPSSRHAAQSVLILRRREAPSRRGGRPGPPPSFETPRCARLLRMRRRSSVVAAMA